MSPNVKGWCLFCKVLSVFDGTHCGTEEGGTVAVLDEYIAEHAFPQEQLLVVCSCSAAQAFMRPAVTKL